MASKPLSSPYATGARRRWPGSGLDEAGGRDWLREALLQECGAARLSAEPRVSTTQVRLARKVVSSDPGESAAHFPGTCPELPA